MRLFNLTSASPMDGLSDFVHYWKQPTPYRWQILGLSVALTFTLIVMAVPKTERAPPAKPDVIWINSWPENRSEKEIIASNIANQKRKDAEAAVEQQREEIRKNFYRDLARASGMDPDELARQYSQPTPAKRAAAPPPTSAGEAKPAATPAPAASKAPPAK